MTPKAGSKAQPSLLLIDVDRAIHVAIRFQHSLQAKVVPRIIISKNMTNWCDRSDLIDLQALTTDGSIERLPRGFFKKASKNPPSAKSGLASLKPHDSQTLVFLPKDLSL